MTLSFAELEAAVAECFYEGWRWEVWMSDWEGPWITIEATTNDARHSGEQVALRIHSPLPPMDTPEQVASWLAWRMWRIASHEAREFFRFRGEIFNDPHEVRPEAPRATAAPSRDFPVWCCEHGHVFEAAAGVPPPRVCPRVVGGEPCPERIAPHARARLDK